MIVSLRDVVGNEEQYAVTELTNDQQPFKEKEVTVRCEITGIPSTGTSGGEKTLYPVDAPTARVDERVLLSFWHDDPEWGGFEKTTKAIRNLVGTVPLQRGEEVLARAIPVHRDDKWYLNVTSLLVRNPEMTIGKNEMRSADECPRIYDLRYRKNVFNPGRYDISKGAIKGDIAHKALERAVEAPEFAENFERGWTEEAVDDLIDTVIEEDFGIEMTLCRLAWVSPNDIKEFAEDAVRNLLVDTSFTNLVSQADHVETERTIADAYGLNGRVDLMVDGSPIDLKTNFFLQDGQKRQHKFQLRLYLFGLLLEDLEQGIQLKEAIDLLPPGVLVYPNLEEESGLVYERVELEHDHVVDVMKLRNQAATLRDSFGVPTTYGRDCSGCYFKSEDAVGSGAGAGQELPSACKFHCQSERRWPCHETTNAGEVKTQCPLYHECDQRLKYRDPGVTDHYNRLRSALQEEIQARRDAGQTMARMTDELLEHAGMRLSDLQFHKEVSGRRATFTSSTATRFEPGVSVRISPDNGETYATATYCGTWNGTHVLEFDGSPAPLFKDPNVTYSATRTIETTSLPRRLLSELDYAQRVGVDPRISESGEVTSTSDRIQPDSVSDIQKYVDHRQVFVNLPARVSRTVKLTQLVRETTQAPFRSIEGAPIPNDERRVLVLGVRLPELATVSDHLLDEAGVIRVDGFESRDDSFGPSTDPHRLYQEIRDCGVLISSAQYALKEGIFHSMTSGDESSRSHSNRFFDAVVITGAEKLTEPEFVFLRELGDRTIAIGDIHREGPEMVSEGARENGLAESYFANAFKRFRTISSETVTSITIKGEAPTAVSGFFEPIGIELDSIGGLVSFHDVIGEERRAKEYMTVERVIHAADESGEPREILLEAVDRGDALYVASQLNALDALDASELTIGQTYTFGETRFRIKNNDIAPDRETGHLVTVNINLSQTPYFTRRILSNPKEAEEVAELVKRENPSVVVTPYEAQAVEIQSRLDDEVQDVPVLTPDMLDGGMAESAIVSLTVANEENIVRPPVSDVETLYSLLTAAESVTVVGDGNTLERNTLTKRLTEW